MKDRRLSVVAICTILALFAVTGPIQRLACAEPAIKDVHTVSELRNALEDDAGAHVRLQADIVFTTSNAAAGDIGVIPGRGYYTIDLNGHKIEYLFMGRAGNEAGAPISMSETRQLTVNGPGTFVSGSAAIESRGREVVTIINGGTFTASAGSAFWLSQGLLVVNGGKLTGSLYGVEMEDGILIRNGGDIKSVLHGARGAQSQNYGVIENAVFTGHANIEDLVLFLDDLTIAEGSSLVLERHAGLIIGNSFVNNGVFEKKSGLLSIGGHASISAESQITIDQDVTFKTLDLENHSHLKIENGATVTVTDRYTNHNGGVIAQNGKLVLLGTIDHQGHAEGVPVLEEIERKGGRAPRDFAPETASAEHLKSLGLFQGVGTKEDGSTDFDLDRPASRPEALVMLIRLLGKEGEVLSGKWPHPFTDVPTWAGDYVGYAYAKGLTKGVSEDSFGTGSVSSQMYLTFVLRSLGYTDEDGKDFDWDKPEQLAMEACIVPQGVDLHAFLRADMALVSEAALDARLKESQQTLFERLKSEGAIDSDAF